MNEYYNPEIPILTDLIAWVIIGSVVGSLIGICKNRTSEGVWLGMLLGPLGWIIVTVMPKGAAAKCPHCHGGGDGTAAVCKHCGRDMKPLPTELPKSLKSLPEFLHCPCNTCSVSIEFPLHAL